MYVIENENEEILSYSSLKIKNNKGMIIDEEDAVLQSHYQAVIEKMTNNRSFVNSVYEEEEILLNPANMFCEYEGGVYIISAEVLLKQLISLILALMLIGGVSRFLYK